MQIKEIQVLSAEMARLLDLTYHELMNILVNLSGNLTDIECGTHIKIPMDAGYVNFYKSSEHYEISLWLKQGMKEQMPKQNNLN